MRESETEGESCGECVQEEATREGEGHGTRGGVSENTRHANGKLLCSAKSFKPEMLSQLSRIKPPEATLEAWLDQLREKVGTCGLAALGIASPLALKGGHPTRHPAAARLVFYLWSALFCPSNLSSAFHLASWGRFNKDMPKDYIQAAERILSRKSGPRRARALGMPYQPFRKPWQGKTPRRMIYTVPPSLPLL
jgi:hypothetical protein